MSARISGGLSRRRMRAVGGCGILILGFLRLGAGGVARVAKEGVSLLIVLVVNRFCISCSLSCRGGILASLYTVVFLVSRGRLSMRRSVRRSAAAIESRAV